MESSTEHGLFVNYDEETGLIEMEWDPVTHPEYNYLEGMTSEEFSQILWNYLQNYEKGQSESCQIQTGRSSCGTTQSNCDTESES